jgi:uncharacterized protein YqjF (DUF2071 family)
MHGIAQDCQETELSRAGRMRLLSARGEPLFIADWDRVLMIHYQVDKKLLERCVPFQLDLYQNRAFVSVVAFTLKAMRPFRGGRLTAWFFKPIATHEFLNVRTYVRYQGETGIFFLAEWLSNRLSVMLGPYPFGLPYRYGQVEYRHIWQEGRLDGTAADPRDQTTFTYRADLPDSAEFRSCQVDSLEEWLMERYTAFTCRAGEATVVSRLAYPLASEPSSGYGYPTKFAREELAILSFSKDEFRKLFSWSARSVDGKASQGLLASKSASDSSGCLNPLQTFNPLCSLKAREVARFFARIPKMISFLPRLPAAHMHDCTEGIT